MCKEFFGLFPFHNWSTIYQNVSRTCMGETYMTLISSGYRKCRRCGEIQEVMWTSQGEFWKPVDEGAAQIINKNIANKKLTWRVHEKNE